MSYAALERAAPPAGNVSGTARTAEETVLTFTLHDNLAAAEPAWRRLEAEGVLTPYQGFGWISALLAAREAKPELAIAVIEHAGAPVALLPLEIDSRFGVRRARLIGAEIGNSDWMIVTPAAVPLLTRRRLTDLLSRVGRMAGIDLIAFFALPASWQGIDNPLLGFPHQPAPDHLFMGELGADGTFNRFDEKRLNNVLRRRRKLGEQAGEVVLRAATTPAEVERFHAAFLEHRAARFAQMGIPNIFAAPHFVKLFRDGAVAGLGEQRPAVIFHALCAGETIVGSACGTFAGTHYSQYINATSGDEAIAKYRLIGLLMQSVFEDVAARGALTIDMGLGDFDYKNDWSVPQTVYDGLVSLTLKGRLAGALTLFTRRLKRAIKQHDRLWSLARAFRARLGTLRRRA